VTGRASLVVDDAELSPELHAFVAEAPLERRAILAFMTRAAASTAPGAGVLDAGAGQAPYRELFSHTRYVTCDWEHSPHPGGRRADVLAPLDRLPLDSGSFDAVLSTQVLEHVADPSAVLAELARVLVAGGRLWATVPFVGELHEEPFDFYRYTSYGLSRLLGEAGFEEIVVEPVGGYFSTLAQLSRNCGLIIGAGSERRDIARRAVAVAGRAAARLLPKLDRLDRRRALPLGWTATARRSA
jgi:SAM-dependent methyltransferase